MEVERLVGGTCGRPFPVYGDLVANLVAAHGSTDAGRDAVVAHVLGTCAGYAYADIETVAMMVTRLGLEDNACVRIAQTVDAMLIFSTAYLVQSRCGRVVILCYRGTEAANLGNWLGDADVGSGSMRLGGECWPCMPGSIGTSAPPAGPSSTSCTSPWRGGRCGIPGKSVDHPLEALYVTGHSLGGAMAVLFALCLAGTPEHRAIADKLRAVYTFGQPLVTGEPLPEAAREVGRKLYRHINARDIIPSLPPAAWGHLAHFGHEYRYAEGEWRQAETPVTQLVNLREVPAFPPGLLRHREAPGLFPLLDGRARPRITTSRRFGRRAASTSSAIRADRRSRSSASDRQHAGPVPHPVAAPARSAARPGRRDRRAPSRAIS